MTSEQIKIRLACIDALEKAQPFGNVAKQSMSEMFFNKEVLVVEHGRDWYGRTIGRVYQGDVDVSAEQIKQGMAWVYRKHTKKLHSTDLKMKQNSTGLDYGLMLNQHHRGRGERKRDELQWALAALETEIYAEED